MAEMIMQKGVTIFRDSLIKLFALPEVMDNYPAEPQPTKFYQLNKIWYEVLDYLSKGSDIYNKLFREYGELRTFDETDASVQLRLFADSWLMELNQKHLEKVLTSNFQLAVKSAKFKHYKANDTAGLSIDINRGTYTKVPDFKSGILVGIRSRRI